MADDGAANSKKTAPGRPFKKGQSGNPSGRPKGSFSFERRLREALEANDEAKGKEIVLAAIAHAIDGNAAYFKQIVDRVDGPVKDEVTGDITIRIIRTRNYSPGSASGSGNVKESSEEV